MMATRISLLVQARCVVIGIPPIGTKVSGVQASSVGCAVNAGVGADADDLVMVIGVIGQAFCLHRLHRSFGESERNRRLGCIPAYVIPKDFSLTDY